MELLTTAEAAGYLRVKERKLYELISERKVPCTKVAGKWLFPRADLDRWLLAGMMRPAGVSPASAPPIVGGSHDPLLQWALSESRAGLAILPEGSETGYRRLLEGTVLAAAIHFHDLADPERDGNLAVVSREPGLDDAVLIGFACREQGLLVAEDNPLQLTSVVDAKTKGARMILRPEGAGAQQLLIGLLRRDSLSLADLVQSAYAPTGPDIAQAIRTNQGDCGVATRAVATAAGLGFIPLCTERFDLVMRQRDYFRGPMQTLLAFVQTPAFAARAAALRGLDVSEAGAIRWAP
ncbi:helix-turn-helix transcriptional regulator [Starkeya sp. ORNL1]|nr:helix-turn-helix transcriptional regulator [Starkeya sp. ORNL1]QJP17879.1 helix-turn-helix transcriptional regulator [Starkeya sp. ORNL1]